MLSRPNTQKIYNTLSKILPGGVNSPVRAFVGLEETPLVIDSAKKDLIYDVDGHEYIDFCASWGALILGHAHQEVLEPVREAILKGTSYGITSEVEARLAEEVVNIVPSIEKVRFCSSGTEATMYACRLARGFTKRDLIVKFIGNYHGNADLFLTKAGSSVATCSESSSKGVPKGTVADTVNVPYNDEEALMECFSKYGDRIAAVIIEPIAGNMGVVWGKLSFHQLLRQLTNKVGALLIYDEVITGFRVGLLGAQGLLGIEPDLSCYGKILGGGFPAAAFGGSKEIMDHLSPVGDVYQAGTLSGNPIAMVAGYQVLRKLQEPSFYETLNAKTDAFLKPIKEALLNRPGLGCIQQAGSMFTLFWGKEQVNNMDDAQSQDKLRFYDFFKTLFFQGVYFPPAMFETAFIMQDHSEEHLEKVQKLIINYIQDAD